MSTERLEHVKTPVNLPASAQGAEARRKMEIAERIDFLKAMTGKISKDVIPSCEEIRRLGIAIRRLGFDSDILDEKERSDAINAIANIAEGAAYLGPGVVDPVDAGLAMNSLYTTRKGWCIVWFCNRSRLADTLAESAYFAIIAAAVGDDSAFRMAKFHERMADEGTPEQREQLSFVAPLLRRLECHYPALNLLVKILAEEGQRNSTLWLGRP